MTFRSLSTASPQAGCEDTNTADAISQTKIPNVLFITIILADETTDIRVLLTKIGPFLKQYVLVVKFNR